ncbi:hypothetical protein COL940_012298 [Colletotrichum noveboracense]|nr:hypothetical protein COL940_012298 [Colletotrichum noveboracense]
MSSELPRNFSTDSARPHTPPSTRPSISVLSSKQDDYPEDHPSPTSDEVDRAVWAGASDSDLDDSTDDSTPHPSTRAPSRSATTRTKSKKSIFSSIFSKFAKTGKRFGFVPNSKNYIPSTKLRLFQPRPTRFNLQTVLQHQIIAELFDGRLHLAPVVKARAVLDIGTGPGLWALEYGKFLTLAFKAS